MCYYLANYNIKAMKYCLLCCSLCLLLALSAGAQTPTRPSSARFNHLAFTVKNLQASTRFYTNILGLDTIPEPFHDGRHSWLKISESGSLHLIEGPLQPEHIKGAHLCFSVESIPLFIEKLKKAAIAFENWAGEPGSFTLRPDGVKQVYLRDPDGYWLEVNDAH